MSSTVNIHSVDVSEAQPVHSHAPAVLASIGSGIGNTLLQFALSVLIPYALTLIHADPTLLAQFQAWDVNDPNGPAEFGTGELVRGLKIDKVKRCGAGIVFFRN